MSRWRVRIVFLGSCPDVSYLPQVLEWVCNWLRPVRRFDPRPDTIFQLQQDHVYPNRQKHPIWPPGADLWTQWRPAAGFPESQGQRVDERNNLRPDGAHGKHRR